jgi:hypothetical protein
VLAQNLQLPFELSLAVGAFVYSWSYRLAMTPELVIDQKHLESKAHTVLRCRCRLLDERAIKRERVLMVLFMSDVLFVTT